MNYHVHKCLSKDCSHVFLSKSRAKQCPECKGTIGIVSKGDVLAWVFEEAEEIAETIRSCVHVDKELDKAKAA